MDINGHCKIVLSAIVPYRKDLLDIALQCLEPNYFQDQILRNIFIILERYAEVTGGILTRDALHDMLYKQMDPGKLVLYDEIFLSLIETDVTDESFRWSIQEIRDLAAERATGEVLSQGIEIFRTGITDDKGILRKGHQEARTHIIEKFSEIDKDLHKQSSPEGDMRLEGSEMLEDYLSRKHSHMTGGSPGILFGIESLDAKIGGLQPGDMGLIVGFTGTGKTSICASLAWSAAVEQGLNVVFLTTETQRSQIRRRILSRHSKYPMFEIPEGLNSRDIKHGTLSAVEENKLQEVIRDITVNSNYGKIYIAQIPQGATISYCASKLYRLQRTFDIQLVIVDYFRLLRSDKRRQTDREEINSVLIEAKQIATTFDGGRGISVVSPWQTSRIQYELAQKMGYYTTLALSESSEASNTPDVIVSFLLSGEVETRYAELRGQVLKNRDGETASGLIVEVDYATSYFSSKKSHSLNELMSDTNQFSGLLR